MRIITSIFLVIGISVIMTSCRISYSMSGANTGTLKTVSVSYFQNRAALAPPTLSQYFTDELRDLCVKQTNMELVSGMGDANFEGEITVYSTRPMAISGDEQAELTRFTIGIKVRYTNAIDDELSFEESFSQYRDYESKQNFESVQTDLSTEILEEISEDIFNRAFVNW
ncbi:MAG: LptE family protein [Bacteroidales bacterium]|nr:LptE family protein [Bacteroidales bacterium]